MASDILIVDDEKDIRLLIKGILEDEGYTVREASGAKSAFDAVESHVPDLIILDIWLEGSAKDGLGILDDLKARIPHVPVLMISGHGTIETAVAAIQKGAYDFIEKPFKADRLILMIQRALERARLMRENEKLKARVQSADDFLGSSASAQSIQQTLKKIADTNSRVLILGEAGTGKGVAARALHRFSRRSEGFFHVVNCITLDPDGFEEEIFDALNTGAASSAEAQASLKGTVFFDEVGDMPLETQGKIVRYLQDDRFRQPSGGNGAGPTQVDVRIIASSSKNLEEEIKGGRFREDLYYRLNVVPLAIPPLRSRPQDIPMLAEHFIRLCAHQSDLKPRRLSDKTLAVLQGYEWPGNARQLKNVMEWMLIMADPAKEVLEPEDLPQILRPSTGRQAQGRAQPSNDYAILPLKDAREAFEKQYLTFQLRRFEGNISRTAQFVGMERSALHRKMKSLDILGADKQDEGTEDQKMGKRA
jgi:two-component system nitrogen regulation response regulator NtrX